MGMPLELWYFALLGISVLDLAVGRKHAHSVGQYDVINPCWKYEKCNANRGLGWTRDGMWLVTSADCTTTVFTEHLSNWTRAAAVDTPGCIENWDLLAGQIGVGLTPGGDSIQVVAAYNRGGCYRFQAMLENSALREITVEGNMDVLHGLGLSATATADASWVACTSEYGARSRPFTRQSAQLFHKGELSKRYGQAVVVSGFHGNFSDWLHGIAFGTAGADGVFDVALCNVARTTESQADTYALSLWQVEPTGSYHVLQEFFNQSNWRVQNSISCQAVAMAGRTWLAMAASNAGTSQVILFAKNGDTGQWALTQRIDGVGAPIALSSTGSFLAAAESCSTSACKPDVHIFSWSKQSNAWKPVAVVTPTYSHKVVRPSPVAIAFRPNRLETQKGVVEFAVSASDGYTYIFKSTEEESNSASVHV